MYVQCIPRAPLSMWLEQFLPHTAQLYANCSPFLVYLPTLLDVYKSVFVEVNRVSDFGSYDLTLTTSVPTVAECTNSDSVSFICKK